MRIGNFGALILCLAKNSSAGGSGECNTHGDCSYGGSCINKKCVCHFDCRSFYPLLYKSDLEIAQSTTCIKIPGDNDRGAVRVAVSSICMAQAEACKRQKEVKIECIGLQCDITSGQCSAPRPSMTRQLCKKDNVCTRNIEGTSGICLRDPITKEKKCHCGEGRAGAKCEKYDQVQRDREVKENSMLFGVSLMIITMFVILAMVAVTRWCYIDRKELKRKSTARLELSNSVRKHLHRLDPVASRSESRVETSLITCAAVNGIHFPMSILMNRSIYHNGRVENIPLSASELTELSSDDCRTPYCSRRSRQNHVNCDTASTMNFLSIDDINIKDSV